MKTAAGYIFVIVWFLHLAVGVGAVLAVMRLWRERTSPFLSKVLLLLLSPALSALSAIVLVFMARGVKFNWKFSTTLFVSMLLWDVLTAPLILFILHGPKATE